MSLANHSTEFVEYFSEWRHFKLLLGTCLCWFLLDIACVILRHVVGPGLTSPQLLRHQLEPKRRFAANRVRWKRRDSGTACSKFPLVESSLLYLDLSLASSLVMSVDDYSQKFHIGLLRLDSHNRYYREEMDSSTRLFARCSLLCFLLHTDGAFQWVFLRAASAYYLRLRSSCVSRSCSSSSTSAQIRRQGAAMKMCSLQCSQRTGRARCRTGLRPRACSRSSSSGW